LYYADFVGEIRGGDSFSDIYGLRRLLLGVIPSVIVILMRKNLTLLPQTYGPFRSRIAKGVARLIMTRSTKLFSRDKDSVEVVQELLRHKGRNKKTGFCPDIAFVMESTTPREMAIHPPLTPHNSAPLIGLNISSLLYFFRERTHGNRFGLKIKYDEFNQALLKQLMEQTEANVLLIPHVFWGGNEPNELDICNSIYAQMNRFSDRIHLVTRQYDQSEMKGIIGMCDFLIGARMHACIAALSQCIPTIGLAYSRKFHGVFQSVQAEQMVVDMREKNQDEALDLIFDALDRRESLAKSLERNIPKIQSQIWDNFKDLLCKTEN
jgi:polysaccharide pyruvyl transferase WcaK-like protein